MPDSHINDISRPYSIINGVFCFPREELSPPYLIVRLRRSYSNIRRLLGIARVISRDDDRVMVETETLLLTLGYVLLVAKSYYRIIIFLSIFLPIYLSVFLFSLRHFLYECTFIHFRPSSKKYMYYRKVHSNFVLE